MSHALVEAGVRPGSQATFVSAKVAKTMVTQVSILDRADAGSGGRPNSQSSNKVRLLMKASARVAGGRRGGDGI